MKNVEIKKDGDNLIITVDLTQSFGRSKSGKTEIIATTAGNKPVENGEEVVYVGLNVYKK